MSALDDLLKVVHDESFSQDMFDLGEQAAADLAALNARVEEMKTDLARCFMELSECGSETFADELAEKYFDTWNEIRELAKGQTK